MWVLTILKDRNFTAPGVNLHHRLTNLTVKKGFFFLIVSMAYLVFLCPLLLFLILDSSEKGLASSSLLFWAFTDMSEIFPDPLFSRMISPAVSATPSVPGALIPPSTFVFFCLAPCSTCSCLPHTGKPRPGHSTQMCLTKAE